MHYRVARPNTCGESDGVFDVVSCDGLDLEFTWTEREEICSGEYTENAGQ